MRPQLKTPAHTPALAAGGRRLVLILAVACTIWLLAAPTAFASTPASGWAASIDALPTQFAPGSTYASDGSRYIIQAIETGAAPSSGPVTIVDTLPAGVTLDPQGAIGFDDSDQTVGEGQNSVSCGGSGQVVTCTDPGPVEPGQAIDVNIFVDVAAGLSGTVTDQVTVSGGGAAQSASASQPTTISSSPSPFGFEPGPAGLNTSITNADGTTDTQAGSHPYQLTVGLALATDYSAETTNDVPPDELRVLTTNLPQGLVVDPDATPVRCTESQLESDLDINSAYSDCPLASQVGVVRITRMVGTGLNGEAGPFAESPLYNMVTPAGVPAELGFDADGIGAYIHLMGSVRTGSDYGLTATASYLPAVDLLPVKGVTVTLWGDPSDPSHDYQRGPCVFSGPCPVSVSQAGGATEPGTPFLTLPSACSGPLETTASADSWEDPGADVTETAPTTDQNGNPVGVSGCDSLDFSPSISVQPDTSVADSPSGLNVDLSVPQSQDPDGLAEANLKDTTVTLPAGVSVSPSAANGLTGCSEAEIGLDNANEPSCPDSSKIGSVQVTTPLLPDVMTGGVYVAQQGNGGAAQGSNPFGSLLAIYVTAQADGASIKLAGQVTANPQTGQLTATFDNNPELPFSDFKLDFFGGPQGVLTTPQACGTYSSSASLSPWSGTPAVSLSGGSFQISSGCVSGFSPSFTAGSQNAQAGAYSPFSVSFSRQDTDQFFSGLSATLPDGELANLSGVAECTSAELATAAGMSGKAELADPSCPAGSLVGTVEAAAGPGASPFYLPGKAYLTGPYKGAPYGLAVIVPAVAGPYDLGTVVVRQQLQINPTTAQVTDVSDPFPTILQGIPLQIRSVTVNMNRPHFTLNPTSCDAMAVTGSLSSTLGITAPVSSRFQVGGCQALPFSPRLRMSLTGKGKTRSGDHPTLMSTLTQRSGQANIASVRVALPLSMALDPNNSQHVCSYYTAKAVTTGPADCPASTLVGHATANTPLLSQPLSGPVYLVQGLSFAHGVETHTLPTLLIPLRGQIALDLRAQTSVSHGKLVTTFPIIPDAPVSKFTLTINGGKKGILVITGRGRNICTGPQTTQATLIGQNGKAVYPNIKMATPCRAPHRRHKHHKK